MKHLADAEIDLCLSRPDRALPVNAQDHLAECVVCRQLYEALLTPPRSFTMPKEASEVAAARAMKASLQPVVTLMTATPKAAVFLLAFIAASTAFVSLTAMTGWNAMTGLQIAIISVVLLAGAALLSFSLAWQIIPGSRRLIPMNQAILFAGALLLGTFAVFFPWNLPEKFAAHGWPCLFDGLAIAVPGALLFWLLTRRGVALDRTQFCVTLGAAAGLFGVAVRQFNCPMPDALHLLVWHGGILALACAAGWLAGHRTPATSQ